MLDILLQSVNTSRLFNGISTMAMHLGGRYMSAEIPRNVERTFNRPFFRRLFIFFIIFLAFRDIKWAILITLLFIIFFNYILDENSKIYIGKLFGYLPEKEEKLEVITAEDLEKAKKVIKKYNDSLENQKIVMEVM